jgi:large subunit ribosomal protein L4
MKIAVHNIKGKETTKKVDLSKDIFGIEPNDHCVYLAVKSEMASLRQGTSSSKTRGEVSGGGKKPWKQKGTGRARIGSTRNPARVHGGAAFGPKPRKYDLKVNSKIKKLARMSVLSSKLKDKKLLVLDKVMIDNPKTKDFISIINALDLNNKKVTFLLNQIEENVYLSSRNLFRINMVESTGASTYDMIDCDVLILDKET